MRHLRWLLVCALLLPGCGGGLPSKVREAFDRCVLAWEAQYEWTFREFDLVDVEAHLEHAELSVPFEKPKWRLVYGFFDLHEDEHARHQAKLREAHRSLLEECNRSGVSAGEIKETIDRHMAKYLAALRARYPEASRHLPYVAAEIAYGEKDREQ